MLIANLRTKRTLLSLAVAAALTLSVQASAADTLQGKVVADEAPNYSTQSGKQYWVLTGTEQTAESNALTINDANGTVKLPDQIPVSHIYLSEADKAVANGNQMTVGGQTSTFASAVLVMNVWADNVDSLEADANKATLNTSADAAGSYAFSNIFATRIGEATIRNSETVIDDVEINVTVDPSDVSLEDLGAFWAWGAYVDNLSAEAGMTSSVHFSGNSLTLSDTKIAAPKEMYVDGVMTEQVNTVVAEDNRFVLENLTITTDTGYFRGVTTVGADEAQIDRNKTTVTDLTFSSTDFAYVEGMEVYDFGRAEAANNTYIADGIELNGSDLILSGGWFQDGDSAVFANNTVNIADVTAGSVSGELLTVYGIQTRDVADVTANATTVTLDKITLSPWDAGSSYETESLWARAVSVSDAETVSASGNLLSAHDVHVHSAILSAAYVSGEDTASVSLIGNKVELSNSETMQSTDFENGLTIYGARAAITGNAEISRNAVSVKDVTAADLRLYGGRYWAVGSTQNASVVMNGNLLEVENVTNTGPEADLWAARAGLGDEAYHSGADISTVTLQNNRARVLDSDFAGQFGVAGAEVDIRGSADVSNNAVELRNVTADHFSALGASYVGYVTADQADVVMNGNTLIAEGVTASDYAQFVAARSFFTDGDEEVYGQNILMQGNRLEMTDATLSGESYVMSVSATDAGEARALNNTLEVSGLTARNDQGTAVTHVVAAHLDATQAVAENNATVVEDSSFTGTTRLWGVRLVAENQGIASENHVALSGTKFSGTSNVAAVSLGATQAETENNVIIVEDSSFTGTTSLLGVRLTAENQGVASGNNVALSGTKFSGTSNVATVLLGATQAETENNAIVVEDSSFTGTTSLLGVQLAAEKRGVASGTSVSVSGATVSGYGLIEAVSVYSQDTVEVNNSTLLLSDVSMDGEPALIAGVDSSGKTVSVQNTLVQATEVDIQDNKELKERNVLAGVSAFITNDGGTFTNKNTVVSVNKSDITNGYVAGTLVALADGGQVEINNQTVVVSYSTVDDVYGTGIVASGNVSARINNQTIVLDNATVVGGVYDVSIKNGTSTRSGNDVELTNSRLQLSGINEVGSISGFDTIGLNVTEANKMNAVLTVKKATGGQTEFDGVTIEIASDDFLDSSDTYQLINVEGGKYTFKDLTVKESHTFIETTYTADGDVVLGNGENLTSENNLFNNKTVKATESSKTLAESLLGTVAFINQGAEFIADEGIAAMVDAAKLGEVTAFGVMQGGSTHYNTGSYVDVDGVTFMAGAGLRVNPNWTMAGFVEAGWANSASHVEGTRGDGDHEYFGVGFATRYQTDGVLYVDGSLRAGRATTEFAGRYGQDSASYDAKSLYMSAHVGLGALWDLSESLKLDTYARYMVTYLDDDDVSLNNRYNDKLDLDSTVTHAVRAGARLLGDFNDYASWKVGAAYEHVFDGDAESAVNSFSLDVPSLEGDTGVFELGLRIRPSLESNWAVDLGAKGYVGDREGVTGNMTVRYSF